MIQNVLILGAGPAGYSAAIYTTRAGFATTLLTGNLPGGQLMMTEHIENYPGFIGLPAYQLMQNMEQQCKDLQITILNKSAAKLSKDPLGIIDEDQQFHNAGAIIIATGARPKLLAVPGESQFMNKGISTCATCDGYFFKDKVVAVIGGGNTAVEDAIYLSRLAKEVHLIHRRDSLRAESILQQQLFKLNNVHFQWNSQVVQFVGGDNLDRIILNTGKTLYVDGAFVAIGHKPNTDWCKDVISTDGEGYIKHSPDTEITGVFVAGDVADKEYRQAITAAGQGCMAAIHAGRYLHTK